MNTLTGKVALGDQLLSAARTLPEDDRDSVRRIIDGFPAPLTIALSDLCKDASDPSLGFIVRMVLAAGEAVLPKRVEVSPFLIFAASIAPVITHFGALSPISVERWHYMSKAIAKQRGNEVAPESLISYYRGLALTLMVDNPSVNGRPDSSHFVWLGSNWSVLEPFVPLLKERSSVDKSLVSPLIDGSNGASSLSSGIL